ncbi:MAG: response regulator, partial [Spirochaetales bacterium]|nr:response regulator [Spirochaetales bacterium]
GDLALKIGEAGTALTVYCGGVETARLGKVSGSRAGSVPRVIPLRVLLPPEESRLEIVLEVSNFEDSNGGGLWGPVYIGSAAAVERERSAALIRDAFISGIFCVIALYHLALFFSRPADLSSLLFAAVCACFFFRQLATGEKPLALLFPSLPWTVLVRIEYLTLYCLAPAYTAFFARLFPSDALRKVRAAMLVFGLASVACALFLPVPLFIATLVPVQIYWILQFFLTGYLIARANGDGRQDARLMLFSFLLLAAAGVNDILVSRFYIPTPILTPLGQIVFILFQFWVLSGTLSRQRRRSEDLERIAKELKAIDEAKTRFFTASSHELRTPVTLIAAPLEAIMKGRYGDAVPRDAPVFTLIQRNCDRLRRLADGLLELLRLDSGTVAPSLRPVNLSQFSENCSALFAPEAARRGISLVCANSGAPVAAETDPVLLETAAMNLLSNALKYTRRDGSIVVDCGIEEAAGNAAEDRRVFFSVRDSGRGIPEERIPRLFERFAAAGLESCRDHTGFGIGLPLAAEIVGALGGEIRVSSEVGAGSLFTVFLPAARSPVPATSAAAGIASGSPVAAISSGAGSPVTAGSTGTAPAAQPAGPSGLAGAAAKNAVSVLLIDDDPDIVSFLAEMLGPVFAFRSACSGEEALALLSGGFRPRVILCDVMMDGMDGFEFRRRLAQDPDLSAVPFLFLSARTDSRNRLAGLEGGAVDYIGKPFSADELEAKIKSLASLSLLESRRLQARVERALGGDSSDASSGNAAFDWRVRADSLSLSGRDRDIVPLLIQGLGDKEIAANLGCSPRTVSNRVSALLKKTGASSRSALVSFMLGGG